MIAAILLIVLLGVFVWLYVKASTEKDIAEMEARMAKHGLEYWKKAYMNLIKKQPN